MQKVSWGIVGTGFIAQRFAEDAVASEYAHIRAVASRSLETAQTFANQYQLETAYGSYQELLEDPTIDAVYIATPHTAHKAQSIAAINAGKHVLCEKPATTSIAELEEILAAASQKNCLFMEGMWTYFLPVFQRVEDWVKEGRIGKLLHVKAEFGFTVPYDPNSRLYNNTLGGGSLLDVGIYPIAAAWRFFKCEPESQHVWSHFAPNGVDDDVVILDSYEEMEATAQLSCSFRSKLHNHLVLSGDKGCIVLPDFWAAKKATLFEGEKVIDLIEDDRNTMGLNCELDAFCQSVMAGDKEVACMSFDDSRALQSLLARVQDTF